MTLEWRGRTLVITWLPVASMGRLAACAPQTAAETEVLYTQWANRSISSTYEPGSTFKSIVLAAALEEGVVT